MKEERALIKSLVKHPSTNVILYKSKFCINRKRKLSLISKITNEVVAEGSNYHELLVSFLRYKPKHKIIIERI